MWATGDPEGSSPTATLPPPLREKGFTQELEGSGAVGCTESCGAIIANNGGAEVGATTATVATTRYIVQVAGMAIGIGAVGNASFVTG